MKIGFYLKNKWQIKSVNLLTISWVEFIKKKTIDIFYKFDLIVI